MMLGGNCRAMPYVMTMTMTSGERMAMGRSCGSPIMMEAPKRSFVRYVKRCEIQPESVDQRIFYGQVRDEVGFSNR